MFYLQWLLAIRFRLILSLANKACVLQQCFFRAGNFINNHLAQRERGDGILFVSFNDAGEATAYFDVELWPQWSIAKFGGAVKAEPDSCSA